MENKRVFIGIPIRVNLQTIVEMIQTTIDAPYGDIKWVFGKNLHLTFAFLGNINQSQIDALSKELEKINLGQPFNAILDHTGTFPNSAEPRVFWLGIDKGKERLIQLESQINGILKKLDFEVDEKEFIPHVTIGRVRDKENVWKVGTSTYLNAVFSPTRFLVKSVHLYESEKTEMGVKYTTIVSNNLH